VKIDQRVKKMQNGGEGGEGGNKTSERIT